MSRTALSRWIVALVLVAWHVPALATVGIGLHLSSHHHHATQETTGERSVGATHHHHHRLTVAPHDHAAVRVVAPSAPLSTPPSVGFELAPVQQAAIAGPLAPGVASRAGPPQLFYSHCALLL